MYFVIGDTWLDSGFAWHAKYVAHNVTPRRQQKQEMFQWRTYVTARLAHIGNEVIMCNWWHIASIPKKGYHILSISGRPLKPRSNIRCNRFATSPRLTIYTNRRGRNKVPDRSRRGCRDVGDWSGTSVRPNQSQPGFCACTKTWLRLIWSQTGPGLVSDQSPISHLLVADRSPTNFVRIGAWLSLKLVGDWSAIGRRLVGDRSATGRRSVGDWSAIGRRLIGVLSATSLQLVGDLSATCSKLYSIS